MTGRGKRCFQTRQGVFMSSFENLTGFFNNFSSPVYISDHETGEILYLNRAARRALNITSDSQYRGRSYPEVFPHIAKLEEENTRASLRSGEFRKWNSFSKRTGHYYFVEETLVPDVKKTWRVGIITLFDHEYELRRKQQSIETGETLLRGVLHLSFQALSAEDSIHAIIRYLGEQLEGDRFYILEENASGLFSDNTYEWCREGVDPHREFLQEVPARRLQQTWYREFDAHNYIAIRDLEDYRYVNRYIYDSLKSKNIRTLAAAPIDAAGRRLGFYAIDDLPPKKIDSLLEICDILGSIFGMILRNRDNEKTEESRRPIDRQTGVYLRNALPDYLKRIDPGQSICYIFCDLNNLKGINDLRGHAEGDRVIAKAAHILSDFFESDPVFRMGGDEFLVIRTDIRESECTELESALKERFRRENVSVAVGAIWRQRADEPFDIPFREVDRKMYADKQEAHNRSLNKNMENTIQLAERMPASCIVRSLDQDDRILYMNRRALAMLNYEDKDTKQLYMKSFLDIIYPDDREDFKRRVVRYEREGYGQAGEDTYQYRARVMTKSGKPRYVYGFVQYYNDPALGKISYNLMYPMSESSVISADSVTGLPGTRQFMDYGDRRMSAPEKGGKSGAGPDVEQWYIIYINLIGFKTYNLDHGYERGDQILRQTAYAIEDSFPGDYVAHLTADHFIVLTVSDDYPQRILTARKKILSIPGNVGVDAKFGVYINSGSDPVSAELCRDYAREVCRTIENSPDQYMRVYDRSLAEKAKLERYIVSHLDDAIAAGSIKAYYQPILRTITGNICAFEALSRWIDPKYGFMDPAKFISVLEKHHLIYKLDCYMIREVCRRLASERRAGHPVAPVSINLSRQDLMTDKIDIFAEIERTVKEFDIPHDLVDFEVTESIVISDPDRMRKIIDRFRAAGYWIVMDDFGSGYSSLNILNEYHFDLLKLDKGFLNSFTEENRKVIANMVKMSGASISSRSARASKPKSS